MRYTLWRWLALLTLAGCAPTVWDKPGATQADFSRDSARCRLVARGMNSGGFYAQGSAQFVAGAELGHALGNAIGQAADYRDCMEANGYTPRTGSATNASYPGPAPGVFGAFAYDQTAARFGYSINQATQARADADALKGCNSTGCKVVFRIGTQQCGALATGDHGQVWGGARRPDKAAAESAAMHDCQLRTSGQCLLRASECDF